MTSKVMIFELVDNLMKYMRINFHGDIFWKYRLAKSQKINSSSHVATDKLIDREIPSLKKLYPSKFLSGKHDMSISVLL